MALRTHSDSYIQYDVSWIFVAVAAVTLSALVCVAFQMVQELRTVIEKTDRDKVKREPSTQFMYIDNRKEKRPLIVSRSCSSFFDMDPHERLKKIV